MSGLHIDTDKCLGCGLCLSSCAAGALRLENDKAVLDHDACLLCGICVDTCPCEAIRLEKAQRGLDLSDYRGIWVFAEQAAGQPLPVVYELLGKGRELADSLGVDLSAVFFGQGIREQADELICYGADQVFLADDQSLAANDESRYCQLLAQLVSQYKPEILLFGATGLGRSLAPRLAARLRTGLTADCTELNIDAQTRLLQQTRPAFGGNLMATIVCPEHRPQMATVRPGVMPALPSDPQRRGQIVTIPYQDRQQPLIELLSARRLQAESIADAEVIVSAGRGIGSSKNLALAQELAQLLGGVLGCSRPLVDTGWCEYKHQIGQTGCAVAPKLLIACGISGAIQHLAGIANAQTIVAINSDPQAPIFSVADYQVVGDCPEVLKALITVLKERQTGA